MVTIPVDANSTENLDITLNNCIYAPGCIFYFGKMMDAFNGSPIDPGTIASKLESYKSAVEADIDSIMELMNE